MILINIMALSILNIGAVPFYTNDNNKSLSFRRRGNVFNLGQVEELQRMTEENLVDALEFIRGPNYRPGPNDHLSSPTYTLPSKIMCPPNTPNNQQSFDFDADADTSDSEADFSKIKKTRKRRRLCSFSTSTASSRRVPHKKTSHEVVNNVESLDVVPDHSGILPRLGFYHDVQEAVLEERLGDHQGDCDADDDDEVKEKWKRLGSSLRNIADKFGQSQGDGVGAGKDVLLDVIPNGVWAAVFKYVFWKFFKGFK